MDFKFYKKSSSFSSSIEIDLSISSNNFVYFKLIENSLFLKRKKNIAIFISKKNNLICQFNRNKIKSNSYLRSESTIINRKNNEILKNYPLHVILQNLKHVHFQQKNRIQKTILTNSFQNFLFPRPQNSINRSKIYQKNFISLSTIKFQSEYERFNRGTDFIDSVFFKNFKVNTIFLNGFYYSPVFFLSKRKIKNGKLNEKYASSFKGNYSKNKWFDWINQQNQFVFSSKSPEIIGNETNKKSIENFHQSKIPLMKYSKLHEFKLVNISLASPEKIKEWAEKILPNGKVFGEVTNANTLHYKTFKPHKGGLFCERIFGPLKDFECACGISSKPTELESKKILQHEQIKRIFCANCDVEYTWSVIRRYQLGYIKLVSPVTHLWYLKANPSYLSLLLDFKRSFLESIIYCTQSITLENIFKNLQITNYLDASPKNLYSLWQKLIEEEKKFQIKSYTFRVGENQKQFFYLSNFLKPFLFFNNSKTNFKMNNNNQFYFTKYDPNKIIKSTIISKELDQVSNSKKTVFSSLFFIIHTLFKGHQFTVKTKKKNNIGNISKNLTINQELNREFLNNKKIFFEKSVKLEKRLKLLHTFYNTINYQSDSSIILQKNKIFRNFPTFQLRQFFYLKNFSFFSNIPNDFDSDKFFKNFYSNRKTIFKNKNCYFKKYFFYSYYKINNLFILYSKNQKNLKKNSYTFGVQKILGTKIVNLFDTTPEYKLKSKSFKNLFIPEIPFSLVSRKKKMQTQLDNQLFLKEHFKSFCLKKTYSKILQIKEKLFSQIFLFYFFEKNAYSLAVQKNFFDINSFFDISKFEIGEKKSFFLFFLFIFFCFLKTKNLISLKSDQKAIKEKIKKLDSKSMNYLNSFSIKQIDIKFFPLNFIPLSGTQKFLKEIFTITFINKNFEILEKTLNYFRKKSFSHFFIQRKLSNNFKKQKDFFYNSGLTLNTKIKKCQIFLNFIRLNFLIASEKNMNIFKKNFVFSIIHEKNWNKKFENVLFQIFLLKKDSMLFINTEKNREFNPLSFVLDKSQINKKMIKSLRFYFYNIFAIKKSHSKNERKNSSDLNQKGKNFFFYNYYSSVIANEIELRKKMLFFRKQKERKFKKFSRSFEQFLENDPENYFKISQFCSKRDFYLSVYKKFGENLLNQNFLESISPFLPKSYFRKKWIFFENRKSQENFDFSSKTLISQRGKKVVQSRKKNSNFLLLKNKSNLKFSQKLQNPIYTISYFYPWSSPLNWKSFIYYNYSSKKLQDKEIKYYKNRNFNSINMVEQIELLNLSSDLSAKKKLSQINKYFREKNSLKDFLFVHENKQLETLTGASLIQKLLTEFDSIELKKMMKQLQILIPILNRFIRKWHKSIYFMNNFENKGIEIKIKSNSQRLDFAKVQKLLQKRDHIIRRLKLISKLSHQNTNPKAMVLTILPVLPPDLRPILKLQNQIAASDLNRLYQRILYRNERFKKFLKDPSTSQSFEMKYAQRLLQESVDNLIENGKGGVKPETNSRGQALKSLSEILKGKQGRFRQYLLGKRVDYSGRSVIVVGPKLKLSECGLPWRIAIELFLPFLIQKILHYKLAKTVVGAKNFISLNQKVTWNLLNEIMKNHPILLNRAPTLHRLGIQAFIPKLIHGKAILLHPLVCPAFNADFDGDQMAVHVPITVEARTEAWSFLFSRNHLLSTATGEPIILPSQDMVLGCYYLTSENLSISLIKSFLSKKRIPSSIFKHFLTIKDTYTNFEKTKEIETISQDSFKFYNFLKNNLKFALKRNCFSDWDGVLNAYQTNRISLQSIIWMKWNGQTEFVNELFSPLEIRIYSCGYSEKIESKSFLSSRQSSTLKKIHSNRFAVQNQKNFHIKYIRTTAGRVLINNIIKNCISF